MFTFHRGVSFIHIRREPAARVCEAKSSWSTAKEKEKKARAGSESLRSKVELEHKFYQNSVGFVFIY